MISYLLSIFNFKSPSCQSQYEHILKIEKNAFSTIRLAPLAPDFASGLLLSSKAYRRATTGRHGERPSNNTINHGFLLIEILCALFFSALFMAIFASSISQIAHYVNQAQSKLEAVTYAR